MNGGEEGGKDGCTYSLLPADTEVTSPNDTDLIGSSSCIPCDKTTCLETA